MKNSIFYLTIDLLLILVLVYQTNHNLNPSLENKLSGKYENSSLRHTAEDMDSLYRNQ